MEDGRKWFQPEVTEVISTTQPPEDTCILQQQPNTAPGIQSLPEQQMVLAKFSIPPSNGISSILPTNYEPHVATSKFCLPRSTSTTLL